MNIESCTFTLIESLLSTNKNDIIIYSSTVLFGNNTIDFSSITNELGSISIANVGNIKIYDSKFALIKANGAIVYNTNTQGSNTNIFTVENCTFEEIKGVCCYMSILSQSFEKVNIISTYYLNLFYSNS